MKKTGKKLLAIATAVSLAALALSGCGGGGAAPSSAAQPSETKKPANKSQVLFSRFLKLFVNLFLCTIRRPALYPAYTKS